jgi:hypothetical protein
MKARPGMGMGDYLKQTVGNRYLAAHAGTLGGGALAAGGTALLAKMLYDKLNK